MSKIRIGFIGCGGIANQKHVPALDGLRDLCEVVAFCDEIEERAIKTAAAAKYNDAAIYTDYRELLKDSSIDVVYVMTPNVVHCPITVDAFAAGKHVLCEKSMAHTTADAQKMMDAWKKNGKKFTIGYQNRFRPEVMALHKKCEKGELGEISYAKAMAVRRRAVPTWGVFPDKSKQGGGPLIDIGTHALDLTLWMMDNYDPETVSGSVFCKLGSLPEAVEGNAFGPWDPKTYEVEDSAFGFIKMKDGATISLEASWALNVMESREASTTLCGTKAGAEIRSGNSYPVDELYINKGENGVLIDEKMVKLHGAAYFDAASSNPEVLEAQQWLDAILFDREPLVKPQEAFCVTNILDAIYRSAEKKQEIHF